MSDPTNTERLDAVIRMTAERMRSGATPIVSIYNALVDLREHLADPVVSKMETVAPGESREPVQYALQCGSCAWVSIRDSDIDDGPCDHCGGHELYSTAVVHTGMEGAVREALDETEAAGDPWVRLGLIEEILTRAMKATEGGE